MTYQLEDSVCMTGGSGFLGRAFLRRAEREKWQARFTVVSRDDHKHHVLLRRFSDVRCVRASVTDDIEYLASIFRGHKTIIHMAASKHVDLSESNIISTIETNVTGTRNVLMAAMAARVDRLVFISTDKACQPANTYGLTKALGEKMVGEFGVRGDVSAVAVRYGNVIGSTGSVIPVFKEQARDFGYLKVTDPNMTRFWMGVEEAIDLILLAHERGNPGSVIIPFPKAMTIGDVGRAVCPDIPQTIVGRRPGEKIDERLLHYSEAGFVVQHLKPQYYELMPPGTPRISEEQITLSSKAPKYWMQIDEMRKLIEDSETV